MKIKGKNGNKKKRRNEVKEVKDGCVKMEGSKSGKRSRMGRRQLHEDERRGKEDVRGQGGEGHSG